MGEKKKFFMNCHLAGRMYHEADEVWNNLKVGTLLKLQRDMDNRYDPDAVKVLYHTRMIIRIIALVIFLARTTMT
jgi:hypothetical protein